MTQQELNTYQNFIDTNNSFLSDIKSFTPVIPNIYLKVELLILYLHHKCNCELTGPITNPTIISLFSNNFYIEDNYIVINEQRYTIEELISIVKNIRFHKCEQLTFINPRESKPLENPTNCRVIDLNRYLFVPNYTLTERGTIFERTCKVDNDTIPYIDEINNRFTSLIEHLIIDIFGDNMDLDEDTYYNVLGAFLKLYPFAGYAANKKTIPYEDISLPLNEIGLTKVKYDDEYLKDLRKKIQSINLQIQRIVRDTEIIISSGFISNKSILERNNRQVIYLNSEIARLLYEYNEYSHNPEVLNDIFFKYIYEAFVHGNVIINEYFADPIIKFFTIEGKEVTSYIAIHLKTLLRIIDPTILSSKSTKKKEYSAN